MSTLTTTKEPFFFGCYLLTSQATGAANYTYIGFTVNPPRRIRQHNGEIKGGAHRTKRNRPWEMVLLVHGFPNKLVSLQFEWAWQNPHLSRHFKTAGSQFARRSKSHYFLPAKIQVMLEMIKMPCWSRLGLRVTVLSQRYLQLYRDLFDKAAAIPRHMPFMVQPLAEMPYFFSTADEDEDDDNDDDDEPEDERENERDDSEAIDIETASQGFNIETSNQQVIDAILNSPVSVKTRSVGVGSRCSVCNKHYFAEDFDYMLACTAKHCNMTSHIVCLSTVFLDADPNGRIKLQPCTGECPQCQEPMIWGNLIRELQVGRTQRQLQGKAVSKGSSSDRRRLQDDFDKDEAEGSGSSSSSSLKPKKRRLQKRSSEDVVL